MSRVLDGKLSILWSVIGWLILALCIPFFAINVSILLSSFSSDEIPTAFGYIPVIQASDALEYHEDTANKGDMLLFHRTDDELTVGTIVAANIGTKLYIRELVSFETQADGTRLIHLSASSEDYDLTVTEASIVGVRSGRVPLIGSIALALQDNSTIVLLICLPLLMFIIFDLTKTIDPNAAAVPAPKASTKRVAPAVSDIKWIEETEFAKAKGVPIHDPTLPPEEQEEADKQRSGANAPPTTRIIK